MIKHNSLPFEIFKVLMKPIFVELTSLKTIDYFSTRFQYINISFVDAHQKVVDKFQQAISFSSVQFYSEI